MNFFINDKNFFKAIEILNINNINYWICHGTLLGLIRDKKLIEWDHDIDIAVWSDKITKKEIIKIFHNENFILQKGFGLSDDIISFKRKGGRIVDINFYEKIFKKKKCYAYVKWYIPKSIVMKTIDALSAGKDYNSYGKKFFHSLSYLKKLFIFIKKVLIKFKLFYKEIGYSEPIEYIEKIKDLNVLEYKIKIPNKPEKYLACIYGKDWKTPKKDYIWYKDSNSLI